MNCSPPDSSVHRILQERLLEWVAIPFSRGSFQPSDQTQVSHFRQILYCLNYQGSPQLPKLIFKLAYIKVQPLCYEDL